MENLKPYLKRVAIVKWKHKKNLEAQYVDMGRAVGGKKKIFLNGNEDYTIKKLKEKIIEQYVDENNRHYFDNSISNIGTFDGNLITKYTDNDGEECDFWTFTTCKLRLSNHTLNLCLLTTSNINGNDSNSFRDTNDKMVPNEDSNMLNDIGEINASNISPNGNEISNPVDSLKISKHVIEKNENMKENYVANKNEIDNTVDSSKISKQIDNLNKEAVKGKESVAAVNEEKQNIDISGVLTDINNLPQFKDKSDFKVRPKNRESSLNPSPSFSKTTSASSVCDAPSLKTSESGSLKFTKPTTIKKNVIEKLNLSVKFIDEKELKFTDRVLGKGGQGIVKKGIYVRTEVAIKTMMKSNYDKFILREIKLLDKIRHPNIVTIMAVSVTPMQFHIVMEYFESVSLHSLLFSKNTKDSSNLTIELKNDLGLQLCTAIAYLHLQEPPIVHRDIKPSNILVNQYYLLKLCDLGLGKCKDLDKDLQSSVNGSMKGTYLYMAPEIILSKGVSNTSTDIWALACTFVELYSEKPVWNVERFSNVLIALISLFSAKKVPNFKTVPVFLQASMLHCFSFVIERRPSICSLQNLFIMEKNIRN